MPRNSDCITSARRSGVQLRPFLAAPLAMLALGLLVSPAAAAAAGTVTVEPLYFLGIPVDFILFALTLLGVALFHHHTLAVALSGLAAITLYKLVFTGFKFGTGLAGLGLHLQSEWVILANLFLLLMGFALLSRHFEKSRIPDEMPAFLPDDWKGGLVLLAIVFVLSSFLDNIAAALIGGTMARHVFRGKVHIGYLAAIVAASNAGGSGSVVGDTTTTMMWIDGISPLKVLDAYIAAVPTLLIFGIPAALQQHRYHPIRKDPPKRLHIEWAYVVIVALILGCRNPRQRDREPALPGAARHDAGDRTRGLDRHPRCRTRAPARLARDAGDLQGHHLPASARDLRLDDAGRNASGRRWQTALGLGFVSAVFDNIPLTALALKQGGYDWGYLAYAVGFGGSMVWFGSSAGVALANMYPEAKSVGLWLRHGWYIALAYVIGFFFMLVVLGWHPDADHKKRVDVQPPAMAFAAF